MLTHKPSAVVFPVDEVLEVVESCCYAFESKNVTANKQGTSKIAKKNKKKIKKVMFCYKNIRNKPSYFPEVCHYLVTTIWLCFVRRQKKSATQDPSEANEPGRPPLLQLCRCSSFNYPAIIKKKQNNVLLAYCQPDILKSCFQPQIPLSTRPPPLSRPFLICPLPLSAPAAAAI